MSALNRRLKALENIMAPSGHPNRIYLLAGEGTSEEVAAFLRAEGWAYDADTDLAILMRPVAVDFRDGLNLGPRQCDDPALTRLRLTRPANPEWRLEAA